MTSADVHDGRMGQALIQGDEQGFFADKAYDSHALHNKLRSRGVTDGISWRVKHPLYPLATWQTWLNVWSASVRSGVERANAIMKRWYG
jgi:IS5 family transposase